MATTTTASRTVKPTNFICDTGKISGRMDGRVDDTNRWGEREGKQKPKKREQKAKNLDLDVFMTSLKQNHSNKAKS